MFFLFGQVFVNFAKYQTDGMGDTLAVHPTEEVVPVFTLDAEKSV